MRIKKTLTGLDQGRDVSLTFQSSSPGKIRGKYLVGIDGAEDRLAIVFDESASFHRDIAQRYRLRPRGGGWLAMDPIHKRIRLSGRSHAYGREPDRDLTRSALLKAFPEFKCAIES